MQKAVFWQLHQENGHPLPLAGNNEGQRIERELSSRESVQRGHCKVVAAVGICYILVSTELRVKQDIWQQYCTHVHSFLFNCSTVSNMMAPFDLILRRSIECDLSRTIAEAGAEKKKRNYCSYWVWVHCAVKEETEGTFFFLNKHNFRSATQRTGWLYYTACMRSTMEMKLQPTLNNFNSNWTDNFFP